MKRRKKKKNSFFFLVCLAIAMIGAVYWHYRPTTPEPSPAEALRIARESLKINDLEQAAAKLEIAGTQPELREWTSLVSAQYLEKAGENDKALTVLEAIPLSSAPSLDARVRALRVKTALRQEGVEDQSTAAQLSALEGECALRGRRDLLSELLLFRARAALKNGKYDIALSLFQKIREDYRGTEVARLARETVLKIALTDDAAAITSSPAYLLEEASLLLSEGDALAALDRLQQAKSKTEASLAAYSEFVFVEEQAMRALGRQREADHLLALLAERPEQEIAEKALVRLARTSWNRDEHEPSLHWLSELKRRFPRSSLLETALYLEGRILEEMARLADAVEKLSVLVDSGENPLLRAKAARRIAWIRYRGRDISGAAALFRKTSELAVSALSQTTIKTQAAPGPDLQESSNAPWSATELRELRDHGWFWEASCLQAIESSGDSSHSRKERLQELLNMLLNISPYSYYSHLAVQHMGQVSSSAADLLSAVGASAAPDSCRLPLPGNLPKTLQILKAGGLEDFAKAEADCFLTAQVGTDLVREQGPADALADLPSEILRLELYRDFVSPAVTIAYGERLLSKAEELIPRGQEMRSCLDYVSSVVHPRPLLELFKKEALAKNIPLPLLLAVARTESHFDREARSRKNALGLLQLLPSTAKEEGLKEDENIMDPNINIALGAAHLSRLLKRYEEPCYAIAAYNAGQTAVDRWRVRFGDVEPLAWIEFVAYPETQNYIKKVLYAEAQYERMGE